MVALVIALMPDYERPCYVEHGVTIPGCWPVVISGDDDDCTCEGSPNAIAMEHRWRAWQRLQGMRERRAKREARSLGLALLPGTTRIEPHRGPIIRVPLRVVGSLAATSIVAAIVVARPKSGGDDRI